MVVEHGAHALPEAIFGFTPMVVASAILVVSYAFIIAERINKAVIALLGASVMIILGVLNQELALQGIDFNTLFLLIGMMIIVEMTKRSGIFQFVAIYAARLVKANPRSLLVVLSLITAVFSALLDNVTTVMLVVPITLLLTEQLKLNPYPFLFAQIFASNIGGMATLIGDPPNILIGSAVGLSFMQFLENLALLSVINMVVMLGIFDLIWGRKMQTSMRARSHLLRYDPFEALTNIPLMWKSLFTIALVLFGFTYGHGQGLEVGTVALGGAALILLLDIYKDDQEKQTHKVHDVLKTVEWETIFFFMGLFILVYGVEHTGLLAIIANKMVEVTGGDLETLGLVMIGGSAVMSAIVDNIPFVATMIPMIESIGETVDDPSAIEPLWWCLAIGACLGGNGSIIGASANVMVASFSQRAGHHIGFIKFMVLAFPLMLLTVAIGTVYAHFMYFAH